jgi:hypothetical protein
MWRISEAVLIIKCHPLEEERTPVPALAILHRSEQNSKENRTGRWGRITSPKK